MGTTISGSALSGTGYRNVDLKVVQNADGFTGSAMIAPSDSPTASLRSSAGGPAPGPTQKNYSGSYTMSGATATIPLETVTTGKSFLITDVAITCSGVTGQALAQIQAAGVTIFSGHLNTTKGIEVPGIETQPTATAGQVVQLAISGGAASAVIAYNIFGIEQ